MSEAPPLPWEFEPDAYRQFVPELAGLDDAGLVTFGRLKVIVDGSLNTRTAWCHDPYPGRPPSAPDAEPSALLDRAAVRTRHV